MGKLKHSFNILVLTVGLLVGCSSGKPTGNTVSPAVLTNQIAYNLGITTSQTEAGLGAMMMLSRNKLSSDDFSKLSKSIPGGANNLINKATGLGVIPGSIGTSNDIVTVLRKAGVGPLSAANFVQEVMRVSKSLGGDSFELLSKVF